MRVRGLAISFLLGLFALSGTACQSVPPEDTLASLALEAETLRLAGEYDAARAVAQRSADFAEANFGDASAIALSARPTK